MRSRRRTTALLILALAGVATLLVTTDLGGGAEDPGERAPRAPSHEATLFADAPAAAEDAPRPTLEGLPAAAPVPRGPVVVRVVDPKGAPVAGVCVTLRRPAGPAGAEPPEEPLVLSDSLGRAPFDDVPCDGRTRAAAWARGDAPAPTLAGVVLKVVTEGSVLTLQGDGDNADGDVPVLSDVVEIAGPVNIAQVGETQGRTLLAEVPVQGPEAVLVVDPGLPLRLDVVLAGDGRGVPTAPVSVTPRLEWASEGARSVHVPGAPGTALTVRAVVAPTPGTGGPAAAEWTTRIHPAAGRLEAVVPLRPEARILVVFPREVLPFRAEDWAAEVTVAGAGVPSPAPRFVGEGRLLVVGGGHHVGDSVLLGGTLAGRWSVSGAAEMGADPREPVVVEAVLNPMPLPVASTGLGLRLRFASTLAAGFLLLPESRGSSTGANGRLHVQVLLPNGRPAVGAVVGVGGWSHRTDASGWARFADLPAGSSRVVVLGAGATGSLDVDVAVGKTTECVLRPGAGAALEVEVVDASGREVPMAALQVEQPSGLPWIDLRDGVQRIDPYTDAHGRRTLEGVESGRVTVHATYGTRSTKAQVDLKDGERRALRLTLPAAFPSVPSPATQEGQ